RVGRFESVTGDAQDRGLVGSDAALPIEFASRADRHPARGLGEYALRLGKQLDRLDNLRIRDVFGPASAASDRPNGIVPVGRIAESERARYGRRSLRQ